MTNYGAIPHHEKSPRKTHSDLSHKKPGKELIMTKDQEKLINELVDRIYDVLVGLEAVQSEEQDYYDSRSEKWQDSDKGQELETRIEQLQSAYDDLENAKGTLESLTEELSAAR